MSASRVRIGVTGGLAALLVAVICPATAAPAGAANPPVVANPASLVDPFIGTSNNGTTWPGATVPFGMIAWSPTSTAGDQTSTGAANGYNFATTRVRGFSLTHLSGAGCNPGAAGDIPIMPLAAAVTSSPSADSRDQTYATNFSHANESARPGRYTVTLDSGVGVDLATTTRAGIGEFSFPTGKPASLLFRTSNSLNGSENADITLNPSTRTVTGSVLTGAFCGRRANGGTNNRRTYYRLFFSATFDQAFTGTGTWKDGTLTTGGTTASGGEGYDVGAARAGRGSGGYVSFASGAKVRMRLGISYVSLAGAVANRDTELLALPTTASVAAAGLAAWNNELRAIGIGGGTAAQQTTFYTALYHALMQPNTVSDVDGRYLGTDMAIHTVVSGQHAQYGTFSGWDQYRAQIQLLALVRGDVAGDFAQSLFAFAQQNRNIWDRWLHLGGATHVMTGDPAAATLATFYAMGVRNFDVTGAFNSLVRQATVQNPDAQNDDGCPGQCTGQRPALNQYLASKYAPNNACHCWGGAAETLENSEADYALGQWAQRLGRPEAASFALRGNYWRNTFNPATGFVQARNVDGSFVAGFTPSTDVGFAQGSSATYTWMVPQNVSGLAQAMGGAARAATRLDGFFHDANGNWAVRGSDALHYDPTNEPGIHAPWLYNGLGQPWKTQATVRQIVNTVYGTGPSGLPGNDDLGTMSAWYVFAALGMFPQAVGRADMLLAAPLFPVAVLTRRGGAVLTITAPAASAANGYVQSASVNQVGLTHSWVGESLVNSGGTINVTVGSTPNTGWGSAPGDLPPDHA